MNEREKLLAKFQKAMPLVNELSSLENNSTKYNKKKGRLSKTIVIIIGMLVLALPYMFVEGIGGYIIGGSPLFILLAIMIWSSTVNKKKIKATDDAITKIFNSEELSFIPFSYRNAVNIVGIYMVLVDMRADTFKEALNVWEQDKHNMIMEAKST